MPEKRHSVYILKCSDGSFYTGYATDVERRLREHNGQDVIAGKSAGARYTHGRRPVILKYTESFTTRSEATKRESEIKKLTRKEKEILVSSSKKLSTGASHKNKKSVL